MVCSDRWWSHRRRSIHFFRLPYVGVAMATASPPSSSSLAGPQFDHRRISMATLMVTWLVISTVPTSVFAVHEVFCTSETFNAVCNPGHVVVVRRALYGRLAASRCITSEYAHALGCYADVTSHVIDACSGADWRQNCSLLVATVDAIAQPCGKDFKSYLDIEYDCVLASYSDDCTHGNVTILTEPEGYLALFARPPIAVNEREPTSSSSSVNVRPNGGVATGRDHGHDAGKSCPWLLVAETGRRYNVSWRLPAAVPSLSTFGGSSANDEHEDEEDDGRSFEAEQHRHNPQHHHLQQQQQQQQHSLSSNNDDDDLDHDDVIDSSLPVIAVCSATWKIVDGGGISTAPSVSLFAACLSGTGGRVGSVGSTAGVGGKMATQPLHADRTYHSTTNRIEIRYTGSVEAMAAAEESVFGRQGQVLGGNDNENDEEGTVGAEPSGVGRRTSSIRGGRMYASPPAVLYYKVIGCSDLVPPEGAFVSRHLDSAAIICNQSAETWYVVCRDGHWSGYVGNCTPPSGEQATLKPTAMSRLQLRFENGVLVAIMVGITLGTIAGAILLGIVFNINRRSRKRSARDTVRHPKYKEPYSSVSIGPSDPSKNVSDDCRQHTSTSLSTSRRFDDVIYPALLFDDPTTASVGRFNGRPVCHDCACAAVTTSSSQCVEFSTSDPTAGNATGSETSLPDCVGPPSICGSPVGMRFTGGCHFPPPPPASSMTSRHQCPVPFVPPPLLRVVRPSMTVDVAKRRGRRPDGVTTWGARDMATCELEADDDCREMPGIFRRLNRRQAPNSTSVDSPSSANSDNDIDTLTTSGHFARYRTMQQQQQQQQKKPDNRDVSILADARLDGYGRSTLVSSGGEMSVVYRI